jgi:hypothetical protein
MGIDAKTGSLVQEIGRLVVNFNSAEYYLRRLAWVLIDPHVDRTGQITIDNLGANGLEGLVRALAPHRLGTDSAIALRIEAAVKTFSDVRSQRNDFVHAVLVVPNDATDLSGMSGVRSKFRRDNHISIGSNDPKLAAQVASEASAVWQELGSLYDLAKAALRSPPSQ